MSRLLLKRVVAAASIAAGCLAMTACMDPVYSAAKSPATAHLSITRPDDLSFGVAPSRVMIAYAYADPVGCLNAQRMVTFPKQPEGTAEIPAGQEFPMLFYTFDRNVVCEVVGGFTPQAGHSYVAHMLEKPPSFWSRVKGALVGGATDGTCGVTFEEQLPDGARQDIAYFIMRSKPVVGATAATCDRAHRFDIDPAAARAAQ